jgi:cell division septation protein DedD
MSALVERIAQSVAQRVVDHLRATDFPGYVDQSTSPLGRRRHIAAVRASRLPGIRVGRRYLARREDVDAYVASSPAAEQPARDRHSIDELAQELGLTRRRNAG